ncbi:MAG: GNAT family N-acetyltransferase [Promethearchaeota archaeon]
MKNDESLDPISSNINNPNFYPFLSGENVSLKPMSMDEAPELLKWFNEPRMHKYLKPRFPRTPKKVKMWVESVMPSEGFPTDIFFTIFFNKNQKAIGACGLNEINWIFRNAELFVTIGDKSYWGKGLAAEANKLLMKYAFFDLNLHKIYVLIFSENIQSLRAAEKSYFVKEAVLKEQVYTDNKFQDLIMLSCFKRDFIKKDKESN